MTQLRFIGINEAGTELEFVDHDGRSFFVSVDSELKAALLDPAGANDEEVELKALAAVANTGKVISHPKFSEVGGITRTPVKIIQARLRAGETIPMIAADTEWEAEKIERFAGPILQERAYIISLAISTAGSREPGALTLGQESEARLTPLGVDLAAVEWNTKRNEDGRWEIKLAYPNREGTGSATWYFDLDNRSLQSVDENAKWILGREAGERDVKSQPATGHGMVFEQSPKPAPKLVAIRTDEPLAPNTISNHPAFSGGGDVRPPKLRSADSGPASESAKRDGVTKKIRIPSWDDIMFGSKSQKQDKSEGSGEDRD